MSVPSYLSAVVVTEGQCEELGGILANLLNQDRPPDEIVVLDNSPRGTGREADHAGDPQVRYLCSGERLELTAARNLAVRSTRGDVLLFMNDYVRFDRYSVTNMVMNAMRPREIACLAFQVRNASSRELIAAEYPGRSTNRWGESREVSQISGSAFAMRRSMFEELGGYDEALFAGEAEIELALRVMRAGWHIRYLPEVLVNYRVSMAFPVLYEPAYRFARNRLYLALKHLPWAPVMTYALGWTVYALYLAARDHDFEAFNRGISALRAEGLWEQAQQYRKAHPPSWALVTLLQKHEGRAWL